VTLAWSRVKKSTIYKCFKTAGILYKDYDVLAPSSHDVWIQFMEADVQIELEGLMEREVTGERCSVEEYIEGDDNLAVCTDLDCENWEANFLASLDKIASQVEMTKSMNQMAKYLAKNFFSS